MDDMSDELARGSAGPGPAEISRIGQQFLASLNHDIRTPLSGIMGMTDLLLETQLDREQQEYVQTARLCAEQLLEMLNSALEYAAIASGSLKIERAEFHLPEALKSLVEGYRPKAESKGLQLLCRLDPNLPGYVQGDVLQLRRAVAPILANAVKFTARGKVEFTAAGDGRFRGGFNLTISVTDTGMGIPAEKLENIFDSFRQLESGLARTHQGFGIGLALAKKLACLMGGGLTVESRVGTGSSFRLWVPLALPCEPPPIEVCGAEYQPVRQPRILFIDDNDVARRVVNHVLQRANYSVFCAAGGAQGIEAASREAYDLVLMDLQMPEVDGFAATAAIRQLDAYADVPIVALTANYSEDFRKTCREAGFQGFLGKPIQSQELLQTLQRLIVK
jgi:CheY-like chemotaxis protein